MSVTPAKPTITVRIATDADLPALAARETAAAQGQAAAHLGLAAAGDYFLVIALLDDEPAGHAALDVREENELRPEVLSMYVYPTARRKGVGAALSAFVEEKAAELGFDEIFLGVTPDNPAAIPLYIGMDYTPTGEHRSAVNLSVLHLDGDQIIRDEDEPTEAIYRKSLRLL